DEVPIKPLKTILVAYPIGQQSPFSPWGDGAKRQRGLCSFTFWIRKIAGICSNLNKFLLLSASGFSFLFLHVVG
ncbi:MAG: hypothetical protein IJF08_00715, partial [Clostridia bacterium]|nr:hypothetical protein [Clostridia bacterium]